MSERRVRGVVKPGKGGARCEDGTWNFGFTFSAWREESGAVMRTPLHLSFNRPDQSALAPVWKLVPDHGVIVVRCGPFEPFGPEPGAQRASVIAIEPSGADEELEAIAREQQKPIVRAHPFFGEMTYDLALHWFEAKRAGLSVHIHAEVDDDLTKAVNAMRRIEPRLANICVQIATKLLSLYNDTWREEDAAIETEASFAARLRVESAVVYGESGRTTLYFEDDDLFAGHMIEVNLDAAGDVEHAGLAG